MTPAGTRLFLCRPRLVRLSWPLLFAPYRPYRLAGLLPAPYRLKWPLWAPERVLNQV